MKTIIVNRYKNSNYDLKSGTFGYIDILGYRIHTIEKPWQFDPVKWPSGKPSESCIPAGTYNLVERYSNRKKRNMMYLVNEDLGIFLYDGNKRTDRGSCMFHAATRVEHIEGCVGLGVNIRVNGGIPMLDKSKLAESFLYDYLRSFNIKTCEIRYV